MKNPAQERFRIQMKRYNQNYPWRLVGCMCRTSRVADEDWSKSLPHYAGQENQLLIHPDFARDFTDSDSAPRTTGK